MKTGDYLYGDVTERALPIEIIEKHINQKDPIRDYIVYTDLLMRRKMSLSIPR